VLQPDPVTDAILDRLQDRLPVNRGYEGVVAEGYDAWIPVDSPLPEEDVYTALLDAEGGPALELGCGTGRPLLRWVAQGREVEGIDSSADMLAILRRHAEARGLAPTVHHGDFAPLRLDRRYAAIVCPAGTFTLVHDADRARTALASYRDHLRPGGLLAVTLYVPAGDLAQELGWRIRRTGTTDDGVTIVVHEATRCDAAARLQVTYNKVERYDGDGLLQATWLRRLHLRWWPRQEFEALLADLGFTDVRSLGDEEVWVATARRAA
jgi:SAM-dependent methyltransferase